jgi:hypothetical protein
VLIADVGYSFSYVRIVLMVNDKWQFVGPSCGRTGTRIIT